MSVDETQPAADTLRSVTERLREVAVKLRECGPVHDDAARIVRLAGDLEAIARDMSLARDSIELERSMAVDPRGFGFEGLPEKIDLADMDSDAIRQIEDEGIPETIDHSIQAEINADQMDEQVALDYPLHWRTWDESWRYLFTLALAAEALGCRPGSRVLDLAAGPGWISEFLHRLSVSTVAVDLSQKMLQVGRERLRLDRRPGRSSPAFFVAADATKLPFQDEAFDGVICLHALHHMPSFEDVLREVHRILRPSGRAVFCEPGSGHAFDPLALMRMRETGAFEKSVRLPLIRLLARRVGFERMSFYPLLDPRDYRLEYTAESRDIEEARRLLEGTLHYLGPRHARFLLEKGSPRPLTTRESPSLIASHSLRAEISCGSAPAIFGHPSLFCDKLVIRNTGDVIWSSQADPYGGQVCVGIKAYSRGGKLRGDLFHQPIPRDLAPGELLEMEIRRPMPLEPGPCTLQYDMVIEGVFWFSQRGSPVARREIMIEPPRAEISLDTATVWLPRGTFLCDKVAVRNTGALSWPSGEDLGGKVMLAARVLTLGGDQVRDDLLRHPIGREVLPGEQVMLAPRLHLLLDPGRYVVAYDLMVEGVGWFSQCDSATARREITVGVLLAEIEPVQVTGRTGPKAHFRDTLRFRNKGDFTWPVDALPLGGPMSVGARLIAADGQVLRDDLGRTPLPRPIPPGDEIVLSLDIAGELLPGRHRLRYDVLVEGIMWLETGGSSTYERELVVDAGAVVDASTDFGCDSVPG